jgi:hypothetical protein
MPYKDKSRQRQAQSDWYHKNKDSISKKRKQNKQESKRWVYNYKLRHSVCAECKVSYPPHILDFDHIKDKSFGISRALQLGTSLEKIKKEIAKCEIVCSNCHRQRTYERQMS